MCVPLHRGVQIGPAKTPSDVSRQDGPAACTCVLRGGDWVVGPVCYTGDKDNSWGWGGGAHV